MSLSVDMDRLQGLLVRGAEADDLEFKSQWDPSQKAALVELCKDIAAMESLPEGGYIIIGANDHGEPSGSFVAEPKRDFDEQKIRSKVASILGEPLDLSVALHRIDTDSYLLIGVGPNRDGMRVMPKDGEYETPTGSKRVWSAGDIFVRRGTSSTRANQHEVRGLMERIIASRKEEWRKEVLETIRAATPAFEPGGFVNVNVEMPAQSFGAAVTELIRRADKVGLDLLLRKTISSAITLINEGTGRDARAVASELGEQLDRLNVIAALSARYGFDSAFADSMQGYRDIYDAVDEDFASVPRRFPLGHKEVLVRLYALGAALVQDRKWTAVATLARLAPISTHNGYWKLLLRKAEVMVARAGVLTDEERGRTGVIEAAKPAAARLFELLGSGVPVELTNLLVEFDVYRGIAAAGKDPAEKLGAYTNFAFYNAGRAEPAFLAVLDDAAARAALFDGPDTELADVYRKMDATARNEAFLFNGWDGFENPRLREFAERDDAA
ncbi:ATP-binding protein (plasmid) [Microbacterium hominis]|uniref:AlbA family DNA-binding domain-containing protein n=1 Tax=Microbacterium hominis TaxID=162426 RepID=UPI0019647FF4|nr:ATP-binding protein [Microbacterium hominis]QRY42314.1 ATP-binding protein [Microbacterium hominis]